MTSLPAVSYAITDISLKSQSEGRSVRLCDSLLVPFTRLHFFFLPLFNESQRRTPANSFDSQKRELEILEQPDTINAALFSRSYFSQGSQEAAVSLDLPFQSLCVPC